MRVELRHVPDDVLEEIENRVVERLREELPKAFPSRELLVDRDGAPCSMAYGDLRLGAV